MWLEQLSLRAPRAGTYFDQGMSPVVSEAVLPKPQTTELRRPRTAILEHRRNGEGVFVGEAVGIKDHVAQHATRALGEQHPGDGFKAWVAPEILAVEGDQMEVLHCVLHAADKQQQQQQQQMGGDAKRIGETLSGTVPCRISQRSHLQQKKNEPQLPPTLAGSSDCATRGGTGGTKQGIKVCTRPVLRFF